LEPLADRVIKTIGQAAELYYRLVMLVAPAGAGKTAVLREVHRRTAAPLVNVNLELSRRMLDLTERQRALKLPRLLAEIVGQSTADVVLLDNIEVLFDVSLKQDPLRLLQGLSRNRTVVAAWSGEIRTEGRGLRTELDTSYDSSHITQSSSLYLVYATTEHPEYKRYPIKDFLYVSASEVERRRFGGICGED
jgi:predicted ATPase